MVSQISLNFQEYTVDRRQLIEKQLAEYLSANDPPQLWESMRYSVLSGGKRLRALLCLAAAESINAESMMMALPCACAIELIHAMSLIHDDLPALDNDDLRRGRPTNHKVYGEALALLAGDALLALATEVLLQHTNSQTDKNILLDVALEMNKSIGANGMVGGQVSDMCLTGLLDLPAGGITALTLENMHRRKTGALIRFSAWSGARLAGASPEQLQAFAGFADLLGLAFQITDDLLDITGSAEDLGKTPGKDAASNKTTWVRFFGIEESRRQLIALQQQASQLLSGTQLPAERLQVLHSLFDYAINRVN
jgi:geranylgeranyl diphosphate synthase, type II